MIYLNNAATSYPKPDSVREAVERYCSQPPFQADRSGSTEAHHDVISSCREKLCRLFCVTSASDIVFTSGATHSLNLLIRGLVKKGDHVVTTQAEHNSVLRLLKTLETQYGIGLTIVSCDRKGSVDPDEIKKCLCENTKVVVVNHCSNVTGSVQDIASIGAIVRDHQAVFIVDAAQSAGTIDIDVSEAHIDALVFAGHKSLFGLPGIGGFYLDKDIKPEPLIVGGTGVKSDYLLQPPERPGYYEAGTPNVPGIVSLNAGLSFLLNTGIEAIRQKKAELKKVVLESFLDRQEITVYGGSSLEDFQQNEAVISFNIAGMSPEDAGYVLEKSFGIVCRSGLHCAPLIHQAIGSAPEGSIRVSFSCFNDKEDVDGLLEAVFQMIDRT